MADSSPKKKTAAKASPAKKAPAKKAAAAKKAAKKAAPKARPPLEPAVPGGVVLLSGGNPQIPMGYGDEPVQAYIAAMPGWKQDLGRRIDQLIGKTVPNVYKAVKWNSPFYGLEDEGWFLNVHCFDKYVKVTFFRGTSLDPMPPGKSKTAETRYYDVREGALDEAQFVTWVKQASALPGEKL